MQKLVVFYTHNSSTSHYSHFVHEGCDGDRGHSSWGTYLHTKLDKEFRGKLFGSILVPLC
jgi:hypothetical protein